MMNTGMGGDEHLNIFLVIGVIAAIAFLYQKWPEITSASTLEKLQDMQKQMKKVRDKVAEFGETNGEYKGKGEDGFWGFLSRHLFVVGGTGAGKSTFLRYLYWKLVGLYPDAQVLSINPHHRDKDGIPVKKVVGAGRDYSEIPEVSEMIIGELDSRFPKYRNDEPFGPPLFIFIDELPAITAYMDKMKSTAFRDMVFQVSCEGRKVGIFLIISTQGMNVESTGFKNRSDFYDNFYEVRVNQPHYSVFKRGTSKADTETLVNKHPFG